MGTWVWIVELEAFLFSTVPLCTHLLTYWKFNNESLMCAQCAQYILIRFIVMRTFRILFLKGFYNSFYLLMCVLHLANDKHHLNLFSIDVHEGAQIHLPEKLWNVQEDWRKHKIHKKKKSWQLLENVESLVFGNHSGCSSNMIMTMNENMIFSICFFLNIGTPLRTSEYQNRTGKLVRAKHRFNNRKLNSYLESWMRKSVYMSKIKHGICSHLRQEQYTYIVHISKDSQIVSNARGSPRVSLK